VRVLDADGLGTTADVAQGILWAATHGAHIINLSLGGDSYSQVLADAIDDATAMGVLVVAATGNDDYQNFISFPGSLENTLAVGATGLNQTRAPYSNKGPEIELSAPGGDLSVDADGDGYPDGILQETTVDGQTSYWFFEGTSMATPHVSGAAALLYAVGVTHPDEIRSLLIGSADDLAGTGWDSGTGFGGLNVVSALEAAVDQLEQAEEEVEEEEEDVTEDPETETPLPGAPEKGSKGEIWKVRVHMLNPYTAAVRWMTTDPGTTEYSGLEGITVVSKTPSRIHKITVKVDQDVGEEITVISRFKSPPNSMATATREIPFGQE
jgi:subtilisin family serine protease